MMLAKGREWGVEAEWGKMGWEHQDRGEGNQRGALFSLRDNVALIALPKNVKNVSNTPSGPCKQHYHYRIHIRLYFEWGLDNITHIWDYGGPDYYQNNNSLFHICRVMLWWWWKLFHQRWKTVTRRPSVLLVKHFHSSHPMSLSQLVGEKGGSQLNREGMKERM